MIYKKLYTVKDKSKSRSANEGSNIRDNEWTFSCDIWNKINFSLSSNFTPNGIIKVKMVLCNVTNWIKDGIVHVDISQCNLTSNERNTTSTTPDFDAAGAMKFTTAVVLVYGIAAMGVLALGFFSRRKRHKEFTEKETSKFIRNYDEVKHTFEKKTRVGVVSALLESVHGPSSNFQHGTQDRKRSLFNNLAFIALADIQEDGETQSSSDENSVALSGKEVILTIEYDDQKSYIGSILSDKMNMDSHTSVSIEDLSSLKGDLESYSDNKQEARRTFESRESYDDEIIKTKTVQLISKTPKPLSLRETAIFDSLTESETETDKLISHTDVLEIEAAKLTTNIETDRLITESEIDKLIKDIEVEIADKRNITKPSSHSDSILHEDHDALTLDLEDEVFLDESNDDNYYDIDLCYYPPRDHSPDWVDVSKG